MVAKMKYISISGHISAMNHVVERYLSRYDIQLEHARNSLMKPFTTLNPYAQTLRKAEKFVQTVGEPPLIYSPIKAADAVNLVEAAHEALDRQNEEIHKMETELQERRVMLDKWQNFVNLYICPARQSDFLHIRFGALSMDNYKRFEKFLPSNIKIIFMTAKQENGLVYGVYFTPAAHREEVDAIFASLGFTETEKPPPQEAENLTPAAYVHSLRLQIAQTEHELKSAEQNALAQICTPERLAIACAKVKHLYAAFDVKKYAQISGGRRVFVFNGWVSEEAAAALAAETDGDPKILFTAHAHTDNTQSPPTLLKNLPIVRQFEFFTRLYGLPQYGEVDPTPLLAVTYTLMFGMMFGDIGHGAVLAVAGVYIMRRKHKNLGGIMQVVGVSSVLFGVLYGSVFGLEFNPIWLRPTTDITETLLLAAGLGVGLIALSMCINMYNCYKNGNLTELLFGANGIAGLMFYSAVLFMGVRLVREGRALTPYAVAVAALPLIFICFKHPIENFIKPRAARKRLAPMQFVGTMAIEMFETLLTYATNTISFVRVGAFAVSHVGMMHVVLQLSYNAAGTQNWLIFIFGNILVLVIEGLLVGIQVLRLDFYEIFSRFYKGTGKEFTPNKIERK